MFRWPRGGGKVSLSASGAVEKVVDDIEEEDEESEQSQHSVGIHNSRPKHIKELYVIYRGKNNARTQCGSQRINYTNDLTH